MIGKQILLVSTFGNAREQCGEYAKMWAEGGMGRGHQADSFLFVGVCVCVCGGKGGLVGHDKASNVALAAKSFTIICTIVKYSLPVS